MKTAAPIFLYLVTSETVPDGLSGDEMISISDEDDDDPDILLDELACMTTLITNCEDNEELRGNISEWWREAMGGTEPTLELLASEPSLMSPDQMDSYAELEDESWSARTPLLVFPRDYSEGRTYAREFVIECALNAH